MRADIDAARASLPKEGERIIDSTGAEYRVAWCSGWVWPLGEPVPVSFYAQPETPEGVIRTELRVVPAHTTAGERYWLTERRSV